MNRFRTIAVVLLGLSITVPLAAGELASVQSAVLLTYQAATRSAGIAALDSLLDHVQDQQAVHLALARALSWERRYDESLQHYAILLREAPAEQLTALEAERLRVLLWQGRTAVAASGYREILARDPRNPDALLGLAQAQRWSGRPLAALELAAQAVDAAPERAEAREELAASYADLGLAKAAEKVLPEGTRNASAELGARLERLASPRWVISPVYSHDSFGITRFADRSTLSFLLPHDARLTVGTGTTHLEQEGQAVETWLAGLALMQSSARVRLDAGLVQYWRPEASLAAAHLGVACSVVDGLGLRFGVRRRPFDEIADGLATDEQAFHGAGVGGAVELDLVRQLHVDELLLALDARPLPGSYFYLDCRGFRVSDDNAGTSLATGLGLDLLEALGAHAPLEFDVHWDTYLTGFSQPRGAYFSPSTFDAQALGGSLRWRMGRHVGLLADGGRTFSFQSGSVGWFGGGGVELGGGPFTSAVRIEARDDLYFRWNRAWSSLAVSF